MRGGGLGDILHSLLSFIHFHSESMNSTILLKVFLYDYNSLYSDFLPYNLRLELGRERKKGKRANVASPYSPKMMHCRVFGPAF
jgi:hypothetical protein